jgi:hypothetical protein
MVRVAVEVREGASVLRETVSADSVRQAVSVMRERYPGRDVRVVFPINPEDFFLEDRRKLSRDQTPSDRISLHSRPRSMARGTR